MFKLKRFNVMRPDQNQIKSNRIKFVQPKITNYKLFHWTFTNCSEVTAAAVGSLHFTKFKKKKQNLKFKTYKLQKP